MESNRMYHYLFKYVFLGIGVIFIFGSIVPYLIPESSEINGTVGEPDLANAIIFGLLGVLMMLLFLLVKDKFAVVEISNQTITIKQGGEVRTVHWTEVDFVSQFRFVQPPLYRIKVKNDDEVVWFNTEPIFVSLNGFTWDKSDMGRLIENKKSELGL